MNVIFAPCQWLAATIGMAAGGCGLVLPPIPKADCANAAEMFSCAQRHADSFTFAPDVHSKCPKFGAQFKCQRKP